MAIVVGINHPRCSNEVHSYPGPNFVPVRRPRKLANLDFGHPCLVGEKVPDRDPPYPLSKRSKIRLEVVAHWHIEEPGAELFADPKDTHGGKVLGDARHISHGRRCHWYRWVDRLLGGSSPTMST